MTAREHTVTGGGGLSLHVSEGGNSDGPSLLFIHGFSQCRLSWAAQFGSDLAADFRLVAMDCRGHGRSGKPRDAYGDSELWAADVHAVITELELVRPVVTGWSYGGLVLCDYLRAHGEAALGGVHLVGAISRIGTAGGNAVIGREFGKAAVASFSTDVATCVAAICDYLRLVTRDPLPDDTAAQLLGYNVIVPPYVREQLFARRQDNDDVLGALTVPALITHGDSDRVVLPAAGEQHAALIPRSRHSVYRDTGHAPFLEDPDRFNRELREFAETCR